MILNDVEFKEVFKATTSMSESPRRFIYHTGFIRDPRTGLHGLIIFKHDGYQIWTISSYKESFDASLNRHQSVFTAPLTDIQHTGRGNDISIVATTVLSKVHHFQFDNETEQFTMKTLLLPGAIFTRQLPNHTLIAATIDGKLVKYSIEGHLQTSVGIPNSPLPKCFVTSKNGKNVIVGDRMGKLYIFDIESMDSQHTIDTGVGTIHSIAFSQDSNQILVSGKQQMIKLFSYEELGTWACVRNFSHHTDTVISITLFGGSNFERFASASNDGTICVWSFSEENPLHIIKLKDEIPTTVQFSPDGLYMVIGTDEATIRIYKTSFAGDYTEAQHFIDEHNMKENFWDLEGNSIFDPLVLRKYLGMFNDESDSLVFYKMEANPQLKLKDAYYQVVEAAAQRLENHKLEIRKLKQQRRRQRRVIAFQSRVELMRQAAAREGRDFVPPTTPPFSDDDDQLDELSDLEGMFERDQPQAEDVKPEENADYLDPFASPLSSTSSDAKPKTDSENDDETQPLPLDLGILSSSDEDGEKEAAGQNSDRKVDRRSLRVQSSSSSSNNPTAAEIEARDRLWASDDEVEAGNNRTPVSGQSDGGFPMNNDDNAEYFRNQQGSPGSEALSARNSASPSRSADSSPLASPPNSADFE